MMMAETMETMEIPQSTEKDVAGVIRRYERGRTCPAGVEVPPSSFHDSRRVSFTSTKDGDAVAPPTPRVVFRELDQMQKELRRERELRERLESSARRSLSERDLLAGGLREVRKRLSHASTANLDPGSGDDIGAELRESLETIKRLSLCVDPNAEEDEPTSPSKVRTTVSFQSLAADAADKLKAVPGSFQTLAADAAAGDDVKPLLGKSSPPLRPVVPRLNLGSIADAYQKPAVVMPSSNVQEGICGNANVQEPPDEGACDQLNSSFPIPKADSTISTGSGWRTIGTASFRSNSSFAPQPQAHWNQNTNTCDVCAKKFTFFLRRHHCRHCGRCVCNPCSPFRMRLQNPVSRPGQVQRRARAARQQPMDSFNPSFTNAGAGAGGFSNPNQAHRVCTACVGPPQQAH